jgi:hypothetical protein
MAFIFSTSHLPESRVRRPDHLEDEEEENDVMQPTPRAGGVRAYSHLPVRDNPAPSTAPLRTDSPRGGIAPIPPRSATPSTSESPMGEAQDDAPLPEADSDPEDDTAPQDHADDRPWYMPRITAQDLPPQDHSEDTHAPAPKPWENTTRSSGFDDAPPEASSTRDSSFSPSPQELRDAFHPPAPRSPVGQAPAQDSKPALPGGRLFEQRSAPEAFLRQQMGKGASGTSSQQRLQESQRTLTARQQPVRESTPPSNGNNPAAPGQAVNPYRGSAPDKMDERRGASPRNITEVRETPAPQQRQPLQPPLPARTPQPQPSAKGTSPSPSEINAVKEELAKLLLARRAAYDKMKNGNMPLSTDELTALMEVDYQRGLLANSDSEGMTLDELQFVADDFFFRVADINKKIHRGHKGFRGSGFALVESGNPQFRNPFLDDMVRGYTDPYFGWEINYNVVGQWIRIAGYSRIEAQAFLAAYLAKRPSKWGTLNLDRQTWFWIGYDYADARQKGWHPTPPEPAPGPAPIP